MTAEDRRQLVALGLLMLALGWIAWEARTFPDRARIFPQLVAVIALVLCSLEIVRILSGGRRAEGEEGTTEPGPSHPLRDRFSAVAPFLVWIAGYYAAVFLLGFSVASFLFVLAFLVLVAEVRWGNALGVASILLLVLLALGRVLNVVWPEGVVGGWLPG